MHRRAFLALLGSAGAAVAVARVPFLRAEEIVTLGAVRRDGARVFVRARCAEAIGAGDVVEWRGHTVRPVQGWPAGPFGVAEAFSPVGRDTWVQIYGPASIRMVMEDDCVQLTDCMIDLRPDVRASVAR